jgi:hypothetical protein
LIIDCPDHITDSDAAHSHSLQLANIIGAGPLKIVLIAVQSNVLATGIESLLNSVDGLAVSRVMFYDKHVVQTEVERLQPTILVLDEAQALAHVKPLVDLFNGQPGLKIVVVNAENNVVQVYERRELCLQVGTDLVQVVQST